MSSSLGRAVPATRRPCRQRCSATAVVAVTTTSSPHHEATLTRSVATALVEEQGAALDLASECNALQIEEQDPAPGPSGRVLLEELAALLRDAGMGAPWLDSWVDAGSLSLVGVRSGEALAEAAVRAAHACQPRGRDAAVVVVAPHTAAGALMLAEAEEDMPVVVRAECFERGAAAAVKDGLDAADREGREVGVVLVPNPLGTGALVPQEELGEILQCVEQRCPGAHVVFDETDGLAVYAEAMAESRGDAMPWGRAAGFISASALLPRGASTAHVIGSFGVAAGLPPGRAVHFAYSQSGEWRGRLPPDTFAHAASMALAERGETVRSTFAANVGFVALRQRLVRDALATLGVATGTSAGIPVHAGGAGLYAWVDLREYLTESDDFIAELELFNDMLYSFGVMLLPGGTCGAITPGWFRICVTGSRAELREGVERLELALRTRNPTGGG
mmetsp:Transcript_29366/g.95694  ORF Transcript_29366/g.95694 Transcript_29366/m.95694 type:complete len:448 (+) Transcript_29366:1-1344(+)